MNSNSQKKIINFPFDKISFEKEYFEKKIFLACSAFDRNLVSMEDLADSLYSIEPAGPKVKLFKHGPIPKPEYVENYQDGNIISSRFKKSALENMLQNGATLVLDRLDQNMTVVNQICGEIAEFLGQRCVGNAYLALGGQGSFGRHWDTHCVFALQLIGKKRWQVFPPSLQNPLTFQSSSKENKECLGKPVFDANLEAGDFLYIPRGWWHEAIPIPGQETVHIAAGVHTSKIHDYVAWLCAEVLPHFTELRHTLPVGSVTDALPDEVIKILKAEITKQENLDTFRQKMQSLTLSKQKIEIQGLI